MKKVQYGFFILTLAAAWVVNLSAGCGSESDGGVPNPNANDGSTRDGPQGDGFIDAILDGSRVDVPECKPVDGACASSAECCTANCANSVCAAPVAGDCGVPDTACTAGTDCCTGSCIGGKCSSKLCVSDNQPCGKNEDCCGGTCSPDGNGGGICKPLNTTCKTTGNSCKTGTDCCSKLCNNGLCAKVAFCTQVGDACGANADCCGGNCVKQAGATLGVCGGAVSAPGATQCSPKGSVCGTSTTTPPDCGGTCCSRVCAPTGAAPGFMICQPPSGCSPTGELCRADSDCCGWSGSPQPLNGPVSCSKSSPTQEFGRCDNGTACREPGSICKPSNESCSAENNCCEPNNAPKDVNCNKNPEDCCRKDALGIPRCLMTYTTCAAPVPAGTTCATSADCCGSPCVNNKCGGTCVQAPGECTTHADCCSGLSCIIPTGATKGTCGTNTPTPTTDAGTPTTDSGTPSPTCSLYGQTCAVDGDCCDGVPCSGGRCRYP